MEFLEGDDETDEENEGERTVWDSMPSTELDQQKEVEVVVDPNASSQAANPSPNAAARPLQTRPSTQKFILPPQLAQQEPNECVACASIFFFSKPTLLFVEMRLRRRNRWHRLLTFCARVLLVVPADHLQDTLSPNLRSASVDDLIELAILHVPMLGRSKQERSELPGVSVLGTTGGCQGEEKFLQKPHEQQVQEAGARSIVALAFSACFSGPCPCPYSCSCGILGKGRQYVYVGLLGE